jgi:NitT/TauT family transport system substrate-binding protein
MQMQKRIWGIGLALCLIALVLTIIVVTQKNSTVQSTAKPVLRIGYLPITHAALPLIVESQSGGKLANFDLEMVKFSNWAELAEALQAGKIDGGGDILNNLAFKIVSKGVPLQSVLMAVRAGSALIVKKEINSVKDLKGKTIAIPSRFSPHYILLYKLLSDQGLKPETDLTLPEMAPPDMVQALASGGIDGFIVAEPFGAQAEEKGIGKVLVLSKDMDIPGSKNLECGITLRKEFIDRYPQAVQEFVEKMIQAGIWVDKDPNAAANLIAPMLGQKPATIIHALIEPPGRSGFVDLYPRKSEYLALEEYMVSLGLLDKKIDIDMFVNDRFAAQAYKKFGLTQQQW